MSGESTYILPRSGAKRESLRTKGQFWTPDWTADFMVAYVLKDKPQRLLDPALGEGVFFRAAKRYAKAQGFHLSLFGCDIDPKVISQAKLSGLTDEDLHNVEIRDFILDPPSQRFPAIIANPPYIRHHRLSPTQKERLRHFARMAIGRHIDGRAGLHVYFLIRALQTLAPEARLAYIVSADVCEGVFANALWQWICSKYRLDAAVTFSSEATPFPDVDTNALVFFIQNAKPTPSFNWVRCLQCGSEEMIALLSGKPLKMPATIEIHRRLLTEALTTGLSRPPSERTGHEYTLGDFAAVMRGIVTGHNDFFFMTSARAKELGIPDSLLVKAIGRTRDVQGDTLTQQHIESLDAGGRPTLLLNVNALPFEKMPPAVQKYLQEGENRGIPEKTLIKTRKPWYRMETRRIPPILFAYLGRRNARFIRNHAQVVPLTCLLCVYPRHSDPAFVERLWRVLSNARTVGNLRKVGKTYGSDAIKVEPRALERLPLPEDLIRAEGLDKYMEPRQKTFDFGVT